MKTSLSLISLAVLSSTAVANNIPPTSLPTNHKVTQGQAEVSQINNAMTIDQKTDRVSIDWESFNIGQQASVTFKQPTSSSIAYNRVTGADISSIQGKLNANGRVFLSNPNGIIFTKEAQVNVGAILATTKEIEKLSEKPKYTYQSDRVSFKRKKEQEGNILNEGHINAEEGIYLIGDTVKNNGKLNLTSKSEDVLKLTYSGQLDGIEVKNKTVLLGAADRFDFNLDNFNIVLTGRELAGLVENNGVIISEDKIELTAKGLNQLKNAVVNNNGVLEANNISMEGGKITLSNTSDIRYGKSNRSGATFNITQVGKDEGTGVKIAGKITALTSTQQANQENNKWNNQFRVGSFAKDENGNVLYTIDKKTIGKAESVERGLRTEDGTLYVNQKDGVFIISSINGGYQTYKYGWSPSFNGDSFQVVQLPYHSNIFTINYKEKDGVYSDLSIKSNIQTLDPVNQRIFEILQNKISTQDYSFLDAKQFNLLTATIIEEQKQALIQKTGITEEQLKRLTEPQTVQSRNYTYNVPEYYLLQDNINDITTSLQQKNSAVTFEDVALLASLLKERRKAEGGEDNFQTKSGYMNDKKEILLPFHITQELADKLHKSLELPITAINAESKVDVDNAIFTHAAGAQHNVVIFANNDENNPLDIHIQNSQIDLGEGSFGIGSGTKLPVLKDEIIQVREENGILIPLYSLSGKADLQKKTLKELLENINLNELSLNIKFSTQNNEQISLSELWKKFVENPTALESQTLDKQNFFTSVKTAFHHYLREQLDDIPNPNLVDVALSRSRFKDGSNFNSIYTKIEAAKEIQEILGLTAQQYAPFNVQLNNVNFSNSKDFIISGGFRSATLDNVNTQDEIGLYINAGNLRTYPSKETNLSERSKKQGYEYVLADLKERVLRGVFSVVGNRYSLSNEKSREKARKELSSSFEDWHLSPWHTRSYIDGTKITINNSQLKSQEGFMHLLAKELEINDSNLNVDYARPLYDSFMPKANKIGLNAEHTLLNNSTLRVNGADTLGSSAIPGAAGIFIIGNLVGRNSEIYAKTYQGYTIRTSGNTSLRGEKNQSDLRITAINTGRYAEDDGATLGGSNGDYFLNGVGFFIGDTIITDDNGEVISGTKTTLNNLTLNTLAPNGALAFKSDTEKHYYPNITVGNDATFNYFELPRIIATGSNRVTGTSRLLSNRDMWRILDHVQSIPSSDLGLQQTTTLGINSSLSTAETMIKANTLLEENSQVEICEDHEGKSCREIPIKVEGEVNVGELF